MAGCRNVKDKKCLLPIIIYDSELEKWHVVIVKTQNPNVYVILLIVNCFLQVALFRALGPTFPDHCILIQLVTRCTDLEESY